MICGHHTGNTVDKNIIATIKMRNKFWYPLKMYCNIGLFSIALL